MTVPRLLVLLLNVLQSVELKKPFTVDDDWVIPISTSVVPLNVIGLVPVALVMVSTPPPTATQVAFVVLATVHTFNASSDVLK